MVADHLRNTKRPFQKTFFVPPTGPVVSSVAQDMSDAVASITSPSGRLRAVLREVSADEKGKKRFVELWEASRLLVQKDVTRMHAEFYADGMSSITYCLFTDPC